MTKKTHLQGAEGGADHDGRVLAVVAELGEQLADLDLHQLQHLFVLHGVCLVDENHHVLHADLPGQQEVLPRLRHLAVGGRHHEDAAVHLSRARDHVLGEDTVADGWKSSTRWNLKRWMFKCI